MSIFNVDSLIKGTGFDRRKFLVNSGKGLLSASVLGSIMGSSGRPGDASLTGSQDTIPVHLARLDHESEKEETPPPAPLDPSKRVGFALVGLGHLTLNQLLPAFGECKYARPVALVSGDAKKAEQVAMQYGIKSSSIYNYQNFDTIKNNPEVQVVYIVLPNSMHEEFTIRSANAGKHVLCEKPMATSSASAQRMVDACKKAAIKLMIAYRIQYEPQHRMVKNWTRTMKYGKVKVIEMFNGQHIGDPTQWRLKKSLAGGGSLPDIGLYCLNTARYLIGEEPQWVSANMYSDKNDIRFKEVEDTVLFQMGFPGGTIVNAGTSYTVHESRRYRCMADKGGWFGMDPAFSYTGLQMEVAAITEGKDWREKPSFPPKDQFALEMDHMAQCVLGNKQPYTPGEEGVQDHKLMEAIYRSANERRTISLETQKGVDLFRGTEPSMK